LEYLRWENELRKYEILDVDKVILDIRLVHFDDGTGWQMGIELRQDPTNNKRWIPANERKAFRGLAYPAWLASFIPISGVTSLCSNASLIPAFGRIFLPKLIPRLNVVISRATTTGTILVVDVHR
jgi:hypothetical protein